MCSLVHRETGIYDRFIVKNVSHWRQPGRLQNCRSNTWEALGCLPRCSYIRHDRIIHFKCTVTRECRRPDNEGQSTNVRVFHRTSHTHCKPRLGAFRVIPNRDEHQLTPSREGGAPCPTCC